MSLSIVLPFGPLDIPGEESSYFLLEDYMFGCQGSHGPDLGESSWSWVWVDPGFGL